MRVLLADDQPQVRSALRLLLDHEPVFMVVGEAANTTDLKTQIMVTQPDILLLDWELPGQAVTDLLPTLRIEYPSLSIIALSGQLEAHQAALAAGVDAFISKGHPPEQLVAALHTMNRPGEKRIKQAKVKDWMTPGLISVSPNLRLTDAHRLMRLRIIRRLGVVRNKRLVGIITLNNVLDEQRSQAKKINTLTAEGMVTNVTVEQVMTPNPTTIFAHDTINKAAHLMQQHNISGLPVVDKQGAPLGMITESNIFEMVVRQWD